MTQKNFKLTDDYRTVLSVQGYKLYENPSTFHYVLYETGVNADGRGRARMVTDWIAPGVKSDPCVTVPMRFIRGMMAVQPPSLSSRTPRNAADIFAAQVEAGRRRSRIDTSGEVPTPAPGAARFIRTNAEISPLTDQTFQFGGINAGTTTWSVSPPEPIELEEPNSLTDPYER